MDTDLEMEDLLHLGFFRGESPKGFILLPINPLVNRLLQCHKPPIKLEIHDQIYAELRAIRAKTCKEHLGRMSALSERAQFNSEKNSRHGKPEPRSSARQEKKSGRSARKKGEL